VKYAFIERQRTNHSIVILCRVLQVSKAGFYDWCERQRHPSSDTLTLDTAARSAHERGRQTYGPKRLRSELIDAGFKMSLSAVKRLRHRLGLRCKHLRKYKATTDSKHNLPIAPNILDRQFTQCTAPNQVWVTDITYIATDEGWLYLAEVKDLFTCKIVGWSMSERMKTDLISKALFMAVQTHKPAPGLIAHSDQGSQYASAQYRRLLNQFGMRQSMSRKGNCWDNAPMESWFASLKKEQVHLQHFKTRAQARSAIFDYIEVFYNKVRRHSKINNMSPADFERKWWKEQEQKAA
jgi:putative transposase